MSTLEERAAQVAAPDLKGSISVRWFVGSAFHVLKTKLIGKVLTIIDASIADQEQRKALKDLVKEAFYSTYDLETMICDHAESSAAITFEGETSGSTRGPLPSDLLSIETEGYEYSFKKL